MKGSSPQPLANLEDIKALKDLGVLGVKKLDNGKRILTRLVNSGYLSEGYY